MKLFDVYPLFDIEPVKGEGCFVFDKDGHKYLDLYGGHAVISIGHSHPHYVEMITKQVQKMGFYSNSIVNPMQTELAKKLGNISGYDDYQLFLCNTGAEAIENALKLASFKTGRKKTISFKKGFHGRTSAAVSITDNPKIIAPVNERENHLLLELNDLESLAIALEKEDIAAVIIEGIQGIGGIHIPNAQFMENAAQLCKNHGTVFIVDEIQSGYGRSGKFFAHQYTNVKPDLITTAKGMGNGFPIGGVLISPEFESWYGMLGTTFGGNHLACAAGIAVIDVISSQKLVKNAEETGKILIDELKQFNQIKEIRGIGLMIGIEFDYEIANLRKDLLFNKKIFTGVSGKNTVRLLPPLTLKKDQVEHFIEQLKKVLTNS